MTPQDFGVDRYLLLNEQTPLLERVKSQNIEFDMIEQQVLYKSSRATEKLNKLSYQRD